MIIRCVYFEGQVAPADQADFDARMCGPVLAALRTYPGLRQVKLRRLQLADVNSPAHYCVFDLYFDSLEAMNTALASPTRQAVRDQVSVAMASFQGRIYHQVFSEN